MMLRHQPVVDRSVIIFESSNHRWTSVIYWTDVSLFFSSQFFSIAWFVNQSRMCQLSFTFDIVYLLWILSSSSGLTGLFLKFGQGIFLALIFVIVRFSNLENRLRQPHMLSRNANVLRRGSFWVYIYIQRKYKFRCKNNKCAMVYIASKLNLLNEEVKKISISIALCTEIDHEIFQCTAVSLACICCCYL